MNGHHIITIGASAGGVEALSKVVGGLPADLPASVFVAMHVPSHGTSLLPQILARGGPCRPPTPRTARRSSRGGSTWRRRTGTC